MGLFESSLEKFEMDEIRDKIAVLLGKTGVGKSSFINCITGTNKCKIGNTTDSCTKNISQVDIAKNGFNYYFVDTPGLDDGKGDENNIKELDSLKKKYPRINTLIICLTLEDLKLSSSLKIMLIKFMELFPCYSFGEHVIILRTFSERSKKFEKKRNNVEGKLLEGINKEKDLIDFMKKNNILMPTKLKEFFVDSDPEELDEETKAEFNLILKEISNMRPFYKETKEEIKEYINEEKNDPFLFIHIRTDRIIKFIDFDGKEHELVQTIGNENYNLDGIKPIMVHVKREQEEKPRGILCWSYYFKTHYYLIKFYEIGGERKRVQSELEWRWEYKDEDGKPIPGEAYREELDKKYNKGNCQL